MLKAAKQSLVVLILVLLQKHFELLLRHISFFG
jgi:hypothetical protein